MPSYNSVRFIEKSILSVLNQNYDNIELIIIDGGSKDGTVDVIKKYQKYIYYWVSEYDNGQSHALNKGLKIATGEYIGWQNSDDIYLPKAFEYISKKFHLSPDIIVGNAITIDAIDNILSKTHFIKPSRKSLLHLGMIITSQSFFWRRNQFNNIRFDEKYQHAMDYDFWLRLMENKYNICFIPYYLGGFRKYPGTKTELNGHQGTVEVENIRKKYGINSSSYFFIINKNLLSINRVLKYFIYRLIYINGIKKRRLFES